MGLLKPRDYRLSPTAFLAPCLVDSKVPPMWEAGEAKNKRPRDLAGAHHQELAAGKLSGMNRPASARRISKGRIWWVRRSPKSTSNPHSAMLRPSYQQE